MGQHVKIGIRLWISCGFAIIILIGISVYKLFESDNASITRSGSSSANFSHNEIPGDVDKQLMDPESLLDKSIKVEKKRLSNWKARFPWRPVHDPEVEFTPELHVSEIAEHRDNADRALIAYHFVLKKFYQDDLRFSSQFESVYDVLDQYGYGENPILAARVFYCLRRYQYAAQYYASDFVMEENTGKPLIRDGKPVTGKAEKEQRFPFIIGAIQSQRRELILSENKHIAYEMANSLIDKVKNMNDLPLHVMSYSHDYPTLRMEEERTQKLLSGEEKLLVPYIGWHKEQKEYWTEHHNEFIVSYENGIELLSELAPDSFHPVGKRNNRFVDNDGNPVKPQPGLTVTLITDFGEAIPLSIEEDGTLIAPSDDEIDEMLEKGLIQEVPLEIMKQLYPEEYGE